MTLTTVAPGKVNLCLFLGGTRDDGRHELVTVFESVSLADDVTLSEAPGPDDVVECDGVDGPNLALDALRALRARGWEAPPLRVKIVKRIPVAAGMGGGSSDAAATLTLAARLAPLSDDVRREVAASLGADVPAQLEPGVSLGTGAGEIVEPLERPRPHAFVIVPLPFALSTADVYREADRLGLPRDAGFLREQYDALIGVLEGGSARLDRSLIVNDLEPAALSLCPVIGSALDAARAAGGEEVFVCGSGPTVAGLFWGTDGASRAAVAARSLCDQFPGAVAASPVGAEFGLPVFA
jgi:4-diphosphocytidyl-2-C-methyl-D-erythritol kinase